jgi:hypothetical protein
MCWKHFPQHYMHLQYPIYKFHGSKKHGKFCTHAVLVTGVKLENHTLFFYWTENHTLSRCSRHSIFIDVQGTLSLFSGTCALVVFARYQRRAKNAQKDKKEDQKIITSRCPRLLGIANQIVRLMWLR